jgi:hypothetical protein
MCSNSMETLEMKNKIEKLSKFDRPPLKIVALPMRTGSMDFMKHPTRMANTLFYTDGTHEKVDELVRIKKESTRTDL